MNLPTLRLPAHTERLVLRYFTQADFDGYAAYHQQAEVYRYLYAAPPNAENLQQDFAERLTPRLNRNDDVLHLAVVRQSDGVLLGEVLLKLASQPALQGEIGYIFNPSFAGQGYATEAVAKMLDLGFGACGFHRIFARLDAANQGSVGVVERLKLRREAHLIQNDRFNGLWGDEYIYALLATEWQQLRCDSGYLSR